MKMGSEFINPTKPILISQEELLQRDKKVIHLSDLSTEIEIVSLEKAIRSSNCFLVDMSAGESEKLTAYKVNFIKISPILKSD